MEVSTSHGSPVATRKDLGGEGVGRIFPSSSRGTSPAAAASQTSGVQDWERVIFCCFMPPSVLLCSSSPQTFTTLLRSPSTARQDPQLDRC